MTDNPIQWLGEAIMTLTEMHILAMLVGVPLLVMFLFPAWWRNIRHGIARFFLMGDSYMQGWNISGKEGVWPKKLPGAEMRHTTISDFPVGVSVGEGPKHDR